MKKRGLLFCLSFLSVLPLFAADTIRITSRDNNLVCRIILNGPAGNAGNLYYELDYKNKPVITKTTKGGKATGKTGKQVIPKSGNIKLT